MDLRALVFLSLIAICAAIASGDGETLIIDDEVDNNDIYLEGSGADNDGGVDTEGEDDVIEGSGSTVAVSTTIPAHSQCLGNTCWCVYTDGTEVMGTRNIGLARCTLKIKPVTTELPLRTKATEPPVQPDIATEVTETDTTDEDITFLNGPSSIKPVVRLEPSTSTSAPEPSTRYNNKITVGPPKVIIDEDMEEDTNEIGGAWKQVNEDAVQRESVDGPFSFAHPGIMAAVIGGGVVGLLCAILLVMFIIYRMRKKDEGSYPLDDSKPLKNYAYAKAPSKEFYA